MRAEKEAERRQVCGTAGSERQPLCQYLAFSPGSTLDLRAQLHPEELAVEAATFIEGAGVSGQVRNCSLSLSRSPTC